MLLLFLLACQDPYGHITDVWSETYDICKPPDPMIWTAAADIHEDCIDKLDADLRVDHASFKLILGFRTNL